MAVALGPAALEFLAAREAAEPPAAPAAQPPTGKGRGGSRAAAPGRTGRWSWLGLGPRRWPLRAVLCCAGGAGASVLGCALRQGLALAVAGAVAQRNMEATAKQVDGGVFGGLIWSAMGGGERSNGSRARFSSHTTRVWVGGRKLQLISAEPSYVSCSQLVVFPLRFFLPTGFVWGVFIGCPPRPRAASRTTTGGCRAPSGSLS